MPLQLGKIGHALLEELLGGLPAPPEELILGPAPGEDACALELPAGVLVVATDPITLTGKDVGRHAVVVNANDVAVTGARPLYFLASVLLPEGFEESDLREIFAAMCDELAKLGACLVGGHTEVTSAVRQPVIVGQMLGRCERGRLLTTGGARPGDALLQVGPAPVEGAAVLAVEASERLSSVSLLARERASAALRDPGISVVDAALLAAELGARAAHDPTEGGLSAGLYELALASGVALDVDESAVLWFEPGVELCAALGADPWGTLASGALLAAFPAAEVERALRELEARGFAARVIATARAGSGVYTAAGRALCRFERDELSRVLDG